VNKTWIGIGCALSLMGTPATSMACGPPTDTLCGIIHTVEPVDMGPDRVGVILQGPFAFGTISCTCEGTSEDVDTAEMASVHLFCESTDDACLEQMDAAIAGEYEGDFALFSSLFPWSKLKGGEGFPSFVISESSHLENVEAWDFQIIQALPPEFAVENRICRAASKIVLPEVPEPIVEGSPTPDEAWNLNLPTHESSSLQEAARQAPTEEPRDDTKLPESDESPLEADPELPPEELTRNPEDDFAPELDEGLPPAGCSTALGSPSANEWAGLLCFLAMGAMLRRREARRVPLVND